MKVVDITHITRKENAVYYSRYFSAKAVLELRTNTTEVPIEFSIETSPLSEKNVVIKFLEQVDYPLVPVINAAKAVILAKDNEGALPL
ncbi:MAG: hypothetical protein Pg6A_12940 [Termitinemataceae bacterium]|nr:MAG: hypothetical protein Pg6A_12940 [Termitinemataceae bacterium]